MTTDTPIAPSSLDEPATTAPGATVGRNAGTALVFSLALVAAIAGTTLCFDAAPGLGWGVWTIVAASGLVIVSWRARGRLLVPVAVALALACALAMGAAVTTDPLFQFLVLSGTASLAAVAALLAAGEPVEAIGARFLALAPIAAFVRVTAESMRRVLGVFELARGKSAALRGSAIALPVVAVLALLLSSADPVFAAWRDGVVNALDADAIPRVIFFSALGGLSLGAYGLAAAPASTRVERVPADVVQRGFLGATERLIVLGSVAALFASFLVLQLAYFVGDVPSVMGSGVTYADWARRGFGELTVAATLAAGLIVGLDRFARRDARERVVRIVSIVVLALVGLLLDSALRRVRLYEQAYGFTVARLDAQAYMLIVAIALVALGVEIRDTIDAKRLARRVALAAVCVLIALTYWNRDAWIARHNLARYAATGRLDTDYLVNGLSPDALPTIVAALPDLPAAEHAAVMTGLHARYDDGRDLARTRWYEWNARRENAGRARSVLSR